MVRLNNVSVKSVALWSVLSGVGIVMLMMGLFFSGPTQKQVLPDARLESLSGEVINLSNFRGKPVVINLWATWCGPCRREMPLFEKMQATYPNITYVFVNQKEGHGEVTRFLQEENLSLENVLLDPQGQLTTQLEVFGLPSTFFFDVEGNLLMAHAGEFSSVDLFNALTDLSRSDP